MMLNTLSPRLVFCGLVLLAIAAMLFARVYLQGYLGLEACPLCMTQRVFVVLWGMIALVAALHNPRSLGRRMYGALCALAATMGARPSKLLIPLSYVAIMGGVCTLIGTSTNLLVIPKNAVIHIQKIAPGPPTKIATATPAILPMPMVPASALDRA